MHLCHSKDTISTYNLSFLIISILTITYLLLQERNIALKLKLKIGK